MTPSTLEPTQVAGFNQFFDDANATEAWRYGGAIDQKFTNVFFGGEYSQRDLDVPFGQGTALNTYDWKEKLARAYLFGTPHEWLSLSAEWLWERFERDKDFADGAKTVETNYFPLSFNFFHPIGFNFTLRGTYVDQQGSFERKDNRRVFENGKDHFWLVDAAIRYRLPKRYGFLTVGVSNLMDDKFQHFDTDRDNPRFQPDRYFFASFTLAVP